jgi:uncharacterized membrane protein (GlpM family)
MKIIPPDLVFWYGLALKMAMTAAIVVTASVAAERSGPFIAALIAALPTAAAAAYIILALEHPPTFIAESAVGSLAANAAVAAFALAYAALAQRHGIVPSLGLATLVWFGAVALLRLITWTIPGALVLNAVVLAGTIPLSIRYRGVADPRERLKRTPYDIPLRAVAVALVVAIVTTASSWIGSYMSGMFAIFPIVMGSFVVIMHPRAGGRTAGAVLAHAQPMLIGLGLGFVGIHYLAVPIGVWWSFIAALAITASWSGIVWFARRQKLLA